jgi:hypothetical protein
MPIPNRPMTTPTYTANFPPRAANETNAAGRLFARPLALFGPDGAALVFDPSTMLCIVDETGVKHYSIRATIDGGGFVTRFLTASEVADYSALASEFASSSAAYAGSLA